MPKHVSVDLETASSEPNAAILAIGAVPFDLEGDLRKEYPKEIGFYVNVDLQSCIDEGLHVSGSTFRWWLQQSVEARGALEAPAPVALAIALMRFGGWIDQLGPDVRLWSHATFDAPILSHAYSVTGEKQPWKFWDARDIRTIVDLAYGSERVPDVPDAYKHNALWDAYRQGIMVQQCWQKIKGMSGAIEGNISILSNTSVSDFEIDGLNDDQVLAIARKLKPHLEALDERGEGGVGG
jgi:hypothetical protein